MCFESYWVEGRPDGAGTESDDQPPGDCLTDCTGTGDSGRSRRQTGCVNRSVTPVDAVHLLAPGGDDRHLSPDGLAEYGGADG